MIECIQSSAKPIVCRKHPEVWIFGEVPTSAHTASAACSTQTSISAAGVDVFEFAQHERPATIRNPPQTVTYTVRGSGGRFQTSTHVATETKTVLPGRHWTAAITRNCPRPTLIDFNVIVKKVIYYVIPPFVHPDGPTSEVVPPATWAAWFSTSTTTSIAASSRSSSPAWTYASGVVTSTSTSSTNSSYAISSSTISSSITGLSTTSSSTTSSSGSSAAPTTSGTGFYLQVTTTPPSLVKRDAVQYVSFDELGNAIVADLIFAALIFSGGNNSFISSGMYLGTPELADSPVRRSFKFPTGFHTWSFVGNLAQLEGTAGFCLDAGSANIIRAYVQPRGCANPIFLVRDVPQTSSLPTSTATGKSSNSLSTSSTSESTTSSRSGSLSTTSSASSTATSNSTPPTSASITSGTTIASSMVGPQTNTISSTLPARQTT
ncbi:hypothetical protein LTR84_010472 [Exophiala bonariae]|uniref:GLEYA adhesin domain-containing protein n=1 Tax=Exophiala bonariae TaxID=1690606 RepID=A0AAV9MT91_9EURO|nr:hypothetical protein LTR84_010472 [Exophiala bonariae]